MVTSLLFSMWTFKVKPAGFKDFKVLTFCLLLCQIHISFLLSQHDCLPSGWVEIYPLTGRQRHDACRGTFSCSLNVLPSVSLPTCKCDGLPWSWFRVERWIQITAATYWLHKQTSGLDYHELSEKFFKKTRKETWVPDISLLDTANIIKWCKFSPNF